MLKSVSYRPEKIFKCEVQKINFKKEFNSESEESAKNLSKKEANSKIVHKNSRKSTCNSDTLSIWESKPKTGMKDEEDYRNDTMTNGILDSSIDDEITE